MKPFRVSASWISFAHGPGADDKQPTAVEICDLMTERDYVFVPLNRFDLVMEIISVAELYINDPHEPKTSAEASRLIKRAKKWIGPVKVSKVAPVVKKHSAFAQKQYARRVAKRKLKEGE